MNRWAIYIDIEGFSRIFTTTSTRAISLLGTLMKYIHLIGCNVYPEVSESLFAHQFGDGFLIVSDSPEKNLERPIAISIALMQILLLHNGVARVGLSHGDYGDYKGCYRYFFGDAIESIEDCTMHIGFGIMTIIPTMGDALIRSYKLHDSPKKGPLLFIDTELRNFIPAKDVVLSEENEKFVELNWIVSTPPSLGKIFSGCGITPPSHDDLKKRLTNYSSSLGEEYKEWKENASKLII